MTEQEAYIIINLIPGTGTVRIQELITAFGSPKTLLEASLSDIAGQYGISKKIAENIVNWKKVTNYELEIELAEKTGTRIITLADREYPEILKQIYNPPLCLYIRGTLPEDNSKNIAVVGSRRTTRYGQKVTAYIAGAAADADWTVVSGLAYGIDAAAHKAVVEKKGKTIAVLGGGLARIHPQDHIPLAGSIIKHNGAVISEFPMNFPPARWSFPMRNRIISGLSRGLIVIEAGERSGSLITAKLALEQGRTVFAVPGEIDNPQAKGTNRLIKNGAILTESFNDILEEFSFIPSYAADKKKKENPKIELTETEQKIISELRRGTMSIDQLSIVLSLPPGPLLATLMQLQIKGLVASLPGKKYELKTLLP